MGRRVTVKTGSQKAFEKPVILVAKVDTTKIKIAGSKISLKPYSGYPEKSYLKVSVIRIDELHLNQYQLPVQKAEFSVIGSDESGHLM